MILFYRPKGYFSSDHAQMIFNLDNNKTYGPYVDGEFLKYSKMLDKKTNGNVRASHILVSYNGSQGASSNYKNQRRCKKRS